MFLGRAKINGSSPDRLFLESNADEVARSIAAGDEVTYFLIRLQDNATTLQPVTLKSGTRRQGPNTEFAEILAGGNVVGESRVDK